MNQYSEKIHCHILNEISVGNLSPGSRVPTEVQLAKKFSTTRMNAHAALDRLRIDGVIVREKRRGSFIKSDLSEESVKSLRNGVSKQVAVYLSDFKDGSYRHWDDTTLSDFEKSLSCHGYNIVYNELPSTRDGIIKALNTLQTQGTCAVILLINRDLMNFMLRNIDVFLDSPLDFYILHRGNVPPQHLPCNIISLNPFGEGNIVGEFLRESELGKIAYVAERFPYWSKERFEGIESILAPLGNKMELTLFSEPELKPLFQKGLDFIKSGGEVIIAHNDHTAAAFIDFVSEFGLKSGEDYKIISFDDNPVFRKYNLTTVSPPINRIATLLAELIIDKKWKKADGVQVTVKVESELVIRNSCRLT